MTNAPEYIGAAAGKYQWDDRTGCDADSDVQGEAFKTYFLKVSKKTVSIYAELDDLNAQVAERRRQSRIVQGPVAKSNPESVAAQQEKDRRRARALLAVSHGSPHVNLIYKAIA